MTNRNIITSKFQHRRKKQAFVAAIHLYNFLRNRGVLNCSFLSFKCIIVLCTPIQYHFNLKVSKYWANEPHQWLLFLNATHKPPFPHQNKNTYLVVETTDLLLYISPLIEIHLLNKSYLLLIFSPLSFLKQVTPFAMLSRSAAGIRGSSLVRLLIILFPNFLSWWCISLPFWKVTSKWW